MMIAKLNDGDEVIFLPNILKNGNYGENIVTSKLYWIDSKKLERVL